MQNTDCQTEEMMSEQALLYLQVIIVFKKIQGSGFNKCFMLWDKDCGSGKEGKSLTSNCGLTHMSKCEIFFNLRKGKYQIILIGYSWTIVLFQKALKWHYSEFVLGR